MNWNMWGRWGAALLVVGCGSKLQVDTNPPGGGGSGGVGGSDLHPEGGGLGGRTSQTDPAATGLLGQKCIPSGTVTEATGSVAQTDIVELARCGDGLTCGPDGLCISIPDCPRASGACIAHLTLPGSGGAGAWSPEDAYGGGVGIGGNGEDLQQARDRVGVQGLAADDSNLYWIEYGTRDSLGNYQNDGAVFSQALSGGAATRITTGLPGPVALGLTSSHAYVYVDGAPLIGNVIHPQLMRVSLAGGAPELVQDGTTPRSFTGVGDIAFWNGLGSLYEQTAEPASMPTVFLADWAEGLTSDGGDLFYDATGGIWRAPLNGGAPQSLALDIFPFEPSGDFIYGLENIDNTGMVLDRAPMTGNAFERARALGAGSFIGGFQIIGDRFFFDSHPLATVNSYSASQLNITTGLLSSSDPPVRLLEAAEPSINQSLVWVATANMVYWSNGRAIYSRPVAESP